MAGNKLLKRKGIVSDDFSDFSLSSPATKIRRLDADLPPIPEEEPNNERALVLFKPLFHSPSSFSLTLDSHLLSEIKKNQFPWSKQCDSECEQEQNENNDRMALVPWVPSPSYRFSTPDDSELMEADEGEADMMMDVEQEDDAINFTSNTSTSTSSVEYPTMLNLQQHQGGIVGGITEGFQQHCMLPQLPQNASTPITWTR